jgi:Rieske Fe-S protein
MSETTGGEPTRRAIVGMGAAMAAAMALPVLVDPRRAEAAAEDKWIATVKPEDLPAGTFRLYRKNSFVLSRVEDKIYALSTTCTHQQCDVQPGLDSATKGQLVCKCHGGHYDAVGKVLQGPPKLPLSHLQTRLGADGTVEVNAGLVVVGDDGGLDVKGK